MLPENRQPNPTIRKIWPVGDKTKRVVGGLRMLFDKEGMSGSSVLSMWLLLKERYMIL